MPPEREIIKSIRSRLENWEMTGTVIWWERLQSLKIQHFGHWIQGCRKGTPDFVAVIRNKQDGLTVLFLEAKGDGGTLRPEQRAFRSRFISVKDIQYIVVTDPLDLDVAVNNLAHDTVGDIEWPEVYTLAVDESVGDIKRPK